LFATLKKRLVTEVLSLELLVVMLLLSVTPKMVKRLELDYPLVPERPFPDLAELPLVSLLVVVELISLSLRPVTNSTNSPERENHGPELEVLP